SRQVRWRIGPRGGRKLRREVLGWARSQGKTVTGTQHEVTLSLHTPVLLVNARQESEDRGLATGVLIFRTRVSFLCFAPSFLNPRASPNAC
ncbi:hypothetical protein LEMLEM_LOCUS11133, partial [Lemmus lemmus]